MYLVGWSKQLEYVCCADGEHVQEDSRQHQGGSRGQEGSPEEGRQGQEVCMLMGHVYDIYALR